MSSPSRQQLDWLMLACVNATVPAMLAWKTYSGDVTVKVSILTAIIILPVMNGVVVVGVRSRRKRQGIETPRSFIFWAVGLAMFSALVTTLTVTSISVRNGYFELALSGTPLNEIQPEQKRLVVELIRRRILNSRDYDRARAEVHNKPLSPALYSPESYVNVDVNHRTISELQKYAEVDFEYSSKQELAKAEFRTKMARIDPTYLQSWDSQRQDQQALETSMISLEKQWLDSVVVLYEFAAKHIEVIKLQGGKLLFSDPAIEQTFQRQQDASEALCSRLKEQSKELITRERQSRSHIADLAGGGMR